MKNTLEFSSPSTVKNDYISFVNCSQKAFSKLISVLMKAIKQKSTYKNEHNVLFVWRRFDISRAGFKGFIRITFRCHGILVNRLKWVPLCYRILSAPKFNQKTQNSILWPIDLSFFLVRIELRVCQGNKRFWFCSRWSTHFWTFVTESSKLTE